MLILTFVVLMKRVQLFEFEDFKWFPGWLRGCLTNLIVVLHRMMGISDVIARLTAKTLSETKQTHIVDMGSGSGGAMPEVLNSLHKHGLTKVKLTMTDLYPNQEQVKKYAGEKYMTYHGESVDATNLASAPKGLKTMINCFHHMPPKAARKILQSAQETKQPILIYEMAENKIPLLLWWLFLPISLTILMVMVLFMTPMVRPLTWKQIVFTYIIPIIPIFYAWDGQASLPRMYTKKDIEELLEGLESDKYVWEQGYGFKSNGKPLGTYVLGRPK